MLAAMRRGVYERDEPLALSLLAALSGESVFLLGMPGVGKSMIGRRLKSAFHNANVFEYLMSRFSTPDEIFGPVSISKLKDEESYERVTRGYLPEADVVFLDEIWKAGPAIQNALLTVLNEKVYLNGNIEMQLPLKGVIAASNELPAEDEGLEALWDRFLIRYMVEPIVSRDNFFRLISGDTNSHGEPISADGFADEEYQTYLKERERVALPEGILECIFKLRERLNERLNAKDPVTGGIKEENRTYYISDRRWKKAVGILRTSAYLNGRDSVDYSDMALLTHMLWNEDSKVQEIRQLVAETIVSTLFSEVLSRHASHQATPSRRISKSDGSYIIDCEGSPLKLTIADYQKIKASPNRHFMASERADGQLVIRTQGEYVLRFVKDGVVTINNFEYTLREEGDNRPAQEVLSAGSLNDALDRASASLYDAMNRNLFLTASSMPKVIQAIVAIYRQRFNR